MPQAAWSRLSEVENRTAEALKGFQAIIESGLFFVETVEPAAELAKLVNQSRIVIEQPRNGVSTLSTRCIQLGGFDETRFEIESAAHNRRYIKSPLVATPVSRADST